MHRPEVERAGHRRPDRAEEDAQQHARRRGTGSEQEALAADQPPQLLPVGAHAAQQGELAGALGQHHGEGVADDHPRHGERDQDEGERGDQHDPVEGAALPGRLADRGVAGVHLDAGAERGPQGLDGAGAGGVRADPDVEPGDGDAGGVLRDRARRDADDRASGEARRAPPVQGADQTGGGGGAVGPGQAHLGAGGGVEPVRGVGVQQHLAGAGRPPAVPQQLPAQRRVLGDGADHGRPVERAPVGGQDPAGAGQPRRHRRHPGGPAGPLDGDRVRPAARSRAGHLDVAGADLGRRGLAEGVHQRPAAADGGDQEGHPQSDRGAAQEQLAQLAAQLGHGVSVRRHRFPGSSALTGHDALAGTAPSLGTPAVATVNTRSLP